MKSKLFATGGHGQTRPPDGDTPDPDDDTGDGAKAADDTGTFDPKSTAAPK